MSRPSAEAVKLAELRAKLNDDRTEACIVIHDTQAQIDELRETVIRSSAHVEAIDAMLARLGDAPAKRVRKAKAGELAV